MSHITDSHIETIQTSTAGLLSHLPCPGDQHWDLVVVHTCSPG